VFDALGTEKHQVDKNAFSCCGEAPLRDLLEGVTAAARVRRGNAEPERPIDIVVTGIETHVCVQQTTLELLKQGHRPLVLQDGVGARSEMAHNIALARFRQCDAVVTNFESLAFEWTRTKDNARFKPMSELVKEGV
jgi:nicotinamidase-related amidase